MGVGNFQTGIQVNIFALAVLAMIIINIRKRPDKNELRQRIFQSMVIINLALIVIDISVDFLNGRSGNFILEVSVLLRTLNYLLMPTVSMLWLVYVKVKIDKLNELSIKRLGLIVFPAVINAGIVLLDIPRDWIYYIDSQNLYHRGSLFIIPSIPAYGYVIYSFLKILKNRLSIRRQDYRVLLAFPIPVLLGGFVQIIYYGPSLIWTSMAFSMLIVFVHIQNNQICKDYLTGLYNRRQLEWHLLKAVKEDKRSIGGIMIDVDNFKHINDKYGHSEGDKVLEYIGNILIYSVRRDDFVARYAGDEFVVIANVKDIGQLERVVVRIRDNIRLFNEKGVLDYDISLSIGYDMYYKQKTTMEFLKQIDSLMYKDKALK